jgi:protein O-GlcNAc transferase
MSDQILSLRLEAAAAHQNGDTDTAARLYQEILVSNPNLDDVWVNYCEILIKNNDIPLAIDGLERALAINPKNTLAWYNLGHGYFRQNEWQAAQHAIEKALELGADLPYVHFLWGNIMLYTGRLPEAVDAYKESLRISPDNAECWCNLGLALYDLYDYDSAAGAYLEALKHDINLVAAHTNLGILLLQVGKLGGAARSFERALKLDPQNMNAINGMGCLESQRGQHDMAIHYFQRAINSATNFWESHSNLLFCLLHRDGTKLDEVMKEHSVWYQKLGSTLARKSVHFINTPDPNRRLRIGFVSGDFRSHPVGYFIFNTFSRLIVEKPFDIYVYANQYEQDDEFALRFRNLTAANWRQIWEVKSEHVLKMIAEDKIDILFDLTGHNARHRLDIFCARAAPVQVTWAGYMATTGVPQMDWLLGDHIQTPATDQPHYTERLYQLPQSFIGYTPPPDAPPLRGTPPCLQNGYITFASFNKPAKITPRAVKLWSEVLNKISDSKLLLKFSGLGDPETTVFLSNQFATHGITPDRLMFEGTSPHAELLDKYNQVDMALDPLPYTGSTTTLEALWMSTPLVTLPGEIFPARHAASYLNAIGATELIAANETDYVEKIVALASDIPRLHHYKQNLREQMRISPLCDQDQFVPAFVTAVQHFWQDYCSRQT